MKSFTGLKWLLLCVAILSPLRGVVAEELSKTCDADDGILLRVSEYVEEIMDFPVEAVRIMKQYHANGGFRPRGLHAAGRDRVLTYLYSLIQSFNGITLYVGTEEGEYFSYFDTEVVYREPGNSGYDPDDPELSIYYNICTDGHDGSLKNCTMNEGAQYVRCVDDCELVKCRLSDNKDCSAYEEWSAGWLECEKAKEVVWCSNYTIETVQPGETLGFVPASYHCIDEFGMLSGEQGNVIWRVDHDSPILPDGNCSHWNNEHIENRNHTGPYAACGVEVCDFAFTGMMRTLEYDPRRRPWYIDTKASHKAIWHAPYPFHFVGDPNLIQRIGISYTEPYYGYTEDGKKVFQGVFAVDYTLDEIGDFFQKNYGDKEDVVVLVFERADPHYLVGISTGTSPYRDVLASDETQPCNEGDECKTIRLEATNIVGDPKSGKPHLNRVGSDAAKAQIAAGFPFRESISVKADVEIKFDTGYFCQSIGYKQYGTNIDWVILVASPMMRSTSDAIMPGEALFIILVIVASLGCIGCGILLSLWCSKRDTLEIRHGDYFFTACFIIGCILLNLSSFTGLGENTDQLCMARMWSMSLGFAITMAPLLVKILRIYILIGRPGRTMRRKKITTKSCLVWAMPIVVVEICILLLFTFVDPPKAAEKYNFDTNPPIRAIECQSQGDGFRITQLCYSTLLTLAGCALSYISRKLYAPFGEARQLFFGMYNVATTGLVYVLLVFLIEDVSYEAILGFQTVLVFWGTVLTCSVFVLPRFFQARRRENDREVSLKQPSGSIKITGLGPDVLELAGWIEKESFDFNASSTKAPEGADALPSTAASRSAANERKELSAASQAKSMGLEEEILDA